MREGERRRKAGGRIEEEERYIHDCNYRMLVHPHKPSGDIQCDCLPPPSSAGSSLC